jgi:hypothetical protein
MPRTLRLTCARTTYFELEISAEDGVRPEDVLAGGVGGDGVSCGRSMIGRPIYRIVEVAGAEEDKISGDPRAEAA